MTRRRRRRRRRSGRGQRIGKGTAGGGGEERGECGKPGHAVRISKKKTLGSWGRSAGRMCMLNERRNVIESSIRVLKGGGHARKRGLKTMTKTGKQQAKKRVQTHCFSALRTKKINLDLPFVSYYFRPDSTHPRPSPSSVLLTSLFPPFPYLPLPSPSLPITFPPSLPLPTLLSPPLLPPLSPHNSILPPPQTCFHCPSRPRSTLAAELSLPAPARRRVALSWNLRRRRGRGMCG